MRFAVDRDRRHRGHVAEQLGALGVEQGDIVQPADVAGEAQLQRPAQPVLAVVFALGRLVDENGRRALHVRPRDLKIDEPERGGGRGGDGQTECERQAECPRPEDVKAQHSA